MLPTKAVRFPPASETAVGRAFALGSLVAVVVGCSSGPSLEGDASSDWVPEIADSVSHGWRDSGEPWLPAEVVPECGGGPGRFGSLDVWADSRTVWLSWTWTRLNAATGVDEAWGSWLGRNEGTGWSEVYAHTCLVGGTADDARCVQRLVGIKGEALVARMASSTGHGVLGEVTSAGVVVWPEALWQAADPYVVNDELAYAVLGGSDTQVARFDGSTWRMLEVPMPFDLPRADQWPLWADETELWVAGATGTILSLQSDGWRVHSLPSLDGVSAIHGFGPDDVWVATRDGKLYRWNGTDWSLLEWPNRARELADPCGEPSWIIGLSGSDGHVFFHTGFELGMCDEGGCSELAYWPDEPGVSGSCLGGIRLLRVRAVTRTDVFVAAAEHAVADFIGEPPAGWASCVAHPLLLYWDGTDFHWI